MNVMWEGRMVLEPGFMDYIIKKRRNDSSAFIRIQSIFNGIFDMIWKIHSHKILSHILPIKPIL